MFHGFLKQSTASQTRTIGPFIDDTDFKTLENGLTIANTDIKLKKNGATAVNKNSGGGTSDVNGKYAVTWDATDTNTVGQLEFSVSVSGALVVSGVYQVLEEAIYDALFDSGANGFDASGRVDVGSWLGAAVKLGSSDNLPQTSPHGWQGVEIPAASNMIEDAGGGDPRWTASALSQAPGSVGGTLSGHWRWSTDTTATDPGSGRVKGNNATLGSITALFIHQIADDGFNFAGAIEDLGLGDTVTVARDGQGGNFILGTVQSEPVDNGDWYTIPVAITDSGGSLGNNNAVNVSFHYQQASAAEIADAVWDEALAAHTSAGSTGEALDDINTNTAGLGGDAMRGTDGANTIAPLSASATADAVWDSQKGDHTVANTFGLAVGDIDTNTAGLNGDAMRGTDGALTLTAGQAAQFRQNIDNSLQGTASGTPTTTTMISDVTITDDDQFKGRALIFNDDTTTPGLRNQYTPITGGTAATNELVFEALTQAPSAGDTFIIV